MGDGAGRVPAVAAELTVKVPLAVPPPNDPEIVTAVELETADVVTVKVPLVDPAATVTLAGSDAAAELSDSDTTAPPLGAAALSLAVPVDDAPPVTLVGLSVSDVSVTEGALVMLNAANSVVLPSVAVSVTVVLSTGNVVTVNVALLAPAGTVTAAGTLAEPGRLLLKLTPIPPAGAALSRVTVPVAEVPPCTLFGVTVKPVSVGKLGWTTRSAERVTPPPVTEMVTTVRVVTAPVVMTNPPKLFEAGIVAKAGTEATCGLLLVTCTS